jgi:hypothetical protein
MPGDSSASSASARRRPTAPGVLPHTGRGDQARPGADGGLHRRSTSRPRVAIDPRRRRPRPSRGGLPLQRTGAPAPSNPGRVGVASRKTDVPPCCARPAGGRNRVVRPAADPPSVPMSLLATLSSSVIPAGDPSGRTGARRYDRNYSRRVPGSSACGCVFLGRFRRPAAPHATAASGELAAAYRRSHRDTCDAVVACRSDRSGGVPARDRDAGCGGRDRSSGAYPAALKPPFPRGTPTACAFLPRAAAS